MADDFCLFHGYEHMKTLFGNPIAYCEACENERNLISSAEKQAAACHCGKDGHALSSVNCPIHGYITVPIMDLENLVIEILRTFDLDSASTSYDDEVIKASKAILAAVLSQSASSSPVSTKLEG